MASSVEVQFEEICRTCMGCVQENPADKTFSLLSIFDFVNDSQSKKVQICDILNIAVPMLPKIDGMDMEMPNNICVRCLEKLFACYEFQNACINSDKRLRDLIHMTTPQAFPTTKEADIQSSLIKQEICENHSDSVKATIPQIPDSLDNEPKNLIQDLQEHCFVENESLDIKEEYAESQFIGGGIAELSSDINWQCENCSQYFHNERLLAKHYNECVDLLGMETPSHYATSSESESNPGQALFDAQASVDFTKAPSFQMNQIDLTEDTNKGDKSNTWPCEICGSIFLHKRSLQRHKKLRHRMTLKCDECSEIFENSTDLNNHKSTLHDKLPYKCKSCPKAFKIVAHLKNHEMVHETDKIFVCAQCDLTFKNIFALRQHSRLHDNQKPYECLFCPEKFRCYSSVYSHQRRVHKDLFFM